MSAQSHTCFTKKGKPRDYYTNRERAEYKLARLIEKKGLNPTFFHVYDCPDCPYFHIGVTSQGRRAMEERSR